MLQQTKSNYTHFEIKLPEKIASENMYKQSIRQGKASKNLLTLTKVTN